MINKWSRLLVGCYLPLQKVSSMTLVFICISKAVCSVTVIKPPFVYTNLCVVVLGYALLLFLDEHMQMHHCSL